MVDIMQVKTRKLHEPISQVDPFPNATAATTISTFKRIVTMTMKDQL